MEQHSPSKHTSSSTGQRPCQRSLKLDCQAKIRLKIQRPKDQSPPFLAITVQYLNYQGHDLTQELTVISNKRSFLFLHMII
ncbi:hypothetical protein RRG08_001344 [Elysia crispata]|uniref:Uncharacterized protein n=1 Tax=Elysia crispata TaxID=231223 RepID=A0AAE1DKQ0_9GAST|nr:hypothetical protein RRG08_001344 [Elysia crispata]